MCRRICLRIFWRGEGTGERTNEQAVSASQAASAFGLAFPHVIDSGKMACTFGLIVKSGITGRKNFGSLGKTYFRFWF